VALGRIGSAAITTLLGTDTTSKACKLFYEPTRDEVLRSHRWNFAEIRAVLSELAEEPAFGWDHAFQLPSDCLRVCEVNDSEIGEGEAWKVEGQTILSDEGTMNIVYIRRVTDAEIFDPLFCEALGLKLATKLVAKLRGNTAQVSALGEEYLRITAPLARRIDSNESRSKRGLLPLRSEWIAARYNGSNLVPWTVEP
jgi:hypothetical protein